MTVNAAWPTTNGAVPGVYAATSTASGNATHSAVGLVPMPTSRAAPTAKPAIVPASPRSAVEPVAVALVRSTDSVPRTIQNACWTSLTLATATAAVSAIAPRTLLRNQTDRRLASAAMMAAARTGVRRGFGSVSGL